MRNTVIESGRCSFLIINERQRRWTKKSEQMQDNISFMKELVPLTEEEKAMTLKIADIINETITVPCTGCSYCTVGCPLQIDIPKAFSLYNADLQEIKEKDWTPQTEYYANMLLTRGNPADCIGCGQCEEMCPQHLPIRVFLQDVAEYFG